MVKVGIIGVGTIADDKHIPQLTEANGCELTAICDINKERLKYIGEKYNIPEKYRFENYIDLINCDNVDAVEICTPTYLHVDMALDVIKAGKPVNVEKPLSVNLEDAMRLSSVTKNPDIKNMMCFSYRFMPAVRYAKEILDKGLIGNIINVNVEYIKASAFMKGRRLEWRFIKKYAGSGVLGDLGVHLIDMAQLLIGDITRVCAKTGIVIKERMKEDCDELGKVETDDYCNFIADFDCGASGVFKISRCAIGHENTIKYDIFGDKGVISFNLNNPDVLDVCLGEIDAESFGMHTIKVPSRFKITQEQMFIDMINNKECGLLPTFKDGIKCQKILDSLLYSSESNKWIEI